MVQKRKKGSLFGGVVIGIILIIGAVVVLWTNEGRPDLSKIARDAIVVRQGAAPAEAQDQLVGITGRLEIKGPAGDREFGVHGDYVKLERKVEMYAWEESESDDKYSYDTTWTTSPADSGQFEYPMGHTNPPMRYGQATFYAQAGQVSGYTFDPSQAHLTRAEGVAPGSDLYLPPNGFIQGEYIHISYSTPYTATGRTAVGDVRISYQAVPTGGTVSLYGVLRGTQVDPFVTNKARLYGVWAGSHEEALVTMHQEYVILGWAMRIGGFMMMWGGLNLLVSPLTNLLGFIPVLGRLGRGVFAAINFGIALVISLVIILISFVAHRWYLVLLVVAVGVGVAVFLAMRRRKQAAL